MLDYLKLDFKSHANPKAIVQNGFVRFTVLTPKLIRMEYDPAGNFEDRPTQIFWHREMPVPKFSQKLEGDSLIIETDDLKLQYKVQDFGFYHRFLQIQLKDSGFVWHFGDKNNSNLLGTVRTLDRIDGAVPLNPGLLSRTGWSLVDDSDSLVFNDDGWLATRNAHPEARDLYFFGYGKAYTECLVDFQKISGQIPIIPRFVLGNWWSRYWEYHQDELVDLMKEFHKRNIPLSVCIVDMDWHIVDTGNASSGWTGYTWNPDLFPNPEQFLDEIHKMDLKTALNLHPALGIYPHEAQYEEMARRLGRDPKSQEPIPFDIADPEFTKAYFEVLHHPLEEIGVDFWWLDWQQGTKTTVEGLDPLFWLNHLHFYDLARDGKKRPFIFSRWGGLGSQRYPIGFSGDTYATWESLQFQPYFTATAANVGYGWWSHDIGGHMGGVVDPELYLRWLQYGVFSPIFRLHSTKNPYLERLPWGFGKDIEIKSASAMRLRHALIPYLYTAAWINYKDGILPIRPMYHLYPDHNDAYRCPNEATFGSELISIPFTTPFDEDTRLSRQVVWLPEGDWFDFFSGEHYQGDGWVAVYGDLDKIPVFARAGAIVPLGPGWTWGAETLPDALTVNIFPGKTNSYQLYEDDGKSQDYLSGAFALTTFSQMWDETSLLFSIDAVNGKKSLLSQKRIYKLVFHSVEKPDALQIKRNDEKCVYEWQYDETTHQLTITDVELSPNDNFKVELGRQSGLLYMSDRRKEVILAMLDTFKLDADVKVRFASKVNDFIDDPSMLVQFADSMKDSHLLALIETWIGKQPDKIADDLDEAFHEVIMKLYN